MATELEIRYKELFHLIPSAGVILRAVDDGQDFVYEDINHAAEVYDNLKKSDIIGRRVCEVYSAAEDLGFVEPLRRVYRSGKTESIGPMYYTDSRLGSRWFQCVMFRLGSGHVVSIYNKVDEFIKAQEELQAKEARLRHIFQVCPIAMAMVENRHVVMANDRFFEMTGYRESEILNMPSRILYPTESEYNYTGNELFKQLDATGKGSIETRSRRKNGDIIDILLTVARLDPNDIESMIITTAIDITDRKRREAELARFHAAIEQTEELVMISTPQGRIEYVNPAFEQETGYSRDELIGKSAGMFKSGQHDIAHYKAIETAVRSGSAWHGQLVNKRKDGSLYTIDCTISPVTDKEGQLIAYVEVQHEISKQIELENRLRHSQRMESIGLLAGGVAHEINNPITGIMNYAELIMDGLGEDAREREFAREIIRESERVAEIVRNLLTFARQEKQSYSPARLIDIVNATLSLAQAIMRHDHVTIEVDVPETLPRIKCRSQQIQQVILSLLYNSRDALNEKYPGFDLNKKILIRSALADVDGVQWIQAIVEDYGAGISPENLANVFDPFFTTKPRDKHMGLGLAISHGIVTEHKGTLTVESIAGEYTRFRMDLMVDNEWNIEHKQS